jgi:hypothetical protein
MRMRSFQDNRWFKRSEDDLKKADATIKRLVREILMLEVGIINLKLMAAFEGRPASTSRRERITSLWR